MAILLSPDSAELMITELPRILTEVVAQAKRKNSPLYLAPANTTLERH
jgi:hypothetical protein